MTTHQQGELHANLADIHQRRLAAAKIRWQDGIITDISITGEPDPALDWLLPGFVDAHVHIESSMLAPAEYARIALTHGVMAAVCDPHEIGNVLGIDGVRYMVDNARQSPFLFHWGAPSCIPATGFETAGAQLSAADISQLLAEGSCKFLSEVMNVPGVLLNLPDVAAKLAAARAMGVPVDGHAPGLRGTDLARYAAAGITTDHECTTLEEALEKIAHGIQILVREGSAARNFDALHPLLTSHPQQVMFCSDDKHPDDLCRNYINGHVRRAIAAGHDLFDVLRAATLNPVRHYGLALGMLRIGDRFDAQLVNNLQDFRVERVWMQGEEVVTQGCCNLPRPLSRTPNRFAAVTGTPTQLQIPGRSGPTRIIGVTDGSLLTREEICELQASNGVLCPAPADDILLLAVVNRYQAATPALALVRGFGLRAGAMASSVAHDSHNIVAVGSDADLLARAINAVVAAGGGLGWADADNTEVLPLPIAGLMSPEDGTTVARQYQRLDQRAKTAGSPLHAPWMTLSFMALLVIPALKLSDQGLFDGQHFRFTALQDFA